MYTGRGVTTIFHTRHERSLLLPTYCMFLPQKNVYNSFSVHDFARVRTSLMLGRETNQNFRWSQRLDNNAPSEVVRTDAATLAESDSTVAVQDTVLLCAFLAGLFDNYQATAFLFRAHGGR